LGSGAWQQKKDFIVNLSRWGNSLDNTILGKARKEILDANKGKPPKVLDPFAGGGAIPLEALRLGCETYASDYSPVATLILKCTVEYPQKYRGDNGQNQQGLVSDKPRSQLLEEVSKWGSWVLQEAKNDIGRFNPEGKDGSITVGYIWARTVPCQNPSCGIEIPLIRQFWLAVKETGDVSLYPYMSNKKVKFKIVGKGYEVVPKGFDPSEGTVSKAVTTCPACRSVIDDKSLRKLFTERKSRERMVAVVMDTEDDGRRYRIASDEDVSVFHQSEMYLQKKQQKLAQQWGIDPVPDEPIHTPDGREYEPGKLLYNFTPVLLYGKTKWGDLFNSRQRLTLVTFTEKVKAAHQAMLEKGLDAEFAKVVTSYLALGIDRLADFGSTLCLLNSTGGRGVFHTFSRQALQMTWDYAESNPFNPSGAGWPTACEKNKKWIEHASSINGEGVSILQNSATKLPYPNDFFDAVFTDPPYYDNVPYAVLSDFFYVWLKRSIGQLYPDLFSTPVAPKTDEAIAELPLLRGMSKNAASRLVGTIKTGSNFEEMLSQSFREIHRVLKPNGIATIVYAHKSAAGWETLINSLLQSGLVVTAAWPLHTEMRGRLRSQESAALASSIYMVARRLQRDQTGFYREIKQALKEHLDAKLEHLWNQGISGADFFIAAIGSSIEIFGRFDKIIDDEGIIIKADKLLEDVRRIVTEYAVRQVLHNGFAGEITPLTRFYVLWRWGYGDVKLQFDDALKLARGVGIDIMEEWNRGFIRKEKEFVRILGPDERNINELQNSRELIDVLHYSLLLWNKGKNDEAVNILKETGFGNSDLFYRVAQAISESLPNGREKKLLEVFLSGKERITERVRKESVQTRLI
jgi:adenine-specific DNA methylase